MGGIRPRFAQNRPRSPHFTQHTASSSQNTQNLQTRANSIISFGNFALQKCYDMNKKFRPIIGMELTEKQQCLLDNLWHVQTVPQASSFKVQVLNALCIYFQEQSQKIPEKQNKRFSHYVIFRGSKIGIFNKWETVAKYIQCPNPIYKGFYSFSEAMKTAREHFGLHSFFVEPEEVKTFSEVAKTNPEQIIKAQEEVIASLQEQLMKSRKNTQHIQFQIENSILKQKEKVFEEKIALYQQKLEQKEKETNTFIHRDFNSFKARVLDFPWQKTLKPVIDQFKECEQIISDKIRREFPIILYELQKKIVSIAFKEENYKGVTVVQRLSTEGESTNVLLLQINLKTTDMPDEQILSFYHNGMIDYLEFSFNSKTEAFLDKLGEKFILTAGNIASYSTNPIIGCKIFSSFPEADSHTYRPARKRIFISHKKEAQQYLKRVACQDNIILDHTWWLDNSFYPDSSTSENKKQIDFARQQLRENWILYGQQTFLLSKIFPWRQYRLLAEGHYIQIWSHHNWNMFLPFIGESEQMSLLDIINTEDNDANTDPGSPQSIDSTHRDF